MERHTPIWLVLLTRWADHNDREAGLEAGAGMALARLNGEFLQTNQVLSNILRLSGAP